MYMNDNRKSERPAGIKLIASVNGVAALLHLLFWIMAFIRLPALSVQETAMEKINLATTYGFGIADIIWSVPLLLTGSIGLWQKKFAGWLGAYLANGLYWYSFTVILVRDLSAQAIAPGTMLFLPFALFAFWAAYYLWQVRLSFNR
jgi:hypothetical protein